MPGFRRSAGLLVALCVAGCGTGGAPTPSSSDAPTPAVTGVRTSGELPSGAAPLPSTAAPNPPDAGLAATVTALESSAGVRLGLAVTGIGRGSAPAVVEAGSLRTQVAWSTAKVPVTVAVLRTPSGTSEATTSLMRRAITASDNAAADDLFALLGTPAVAAAATQTVIREAGDQRTVVPSTRLREDYSIVGQTDWPAAAQARFLGDLACRPDAQPVLELMGQFEADQRWGLGRLPGARIKGGWGPTPSGGYQVRQMGLVTLASRPHAVALLAEAPTFEQGTAALSRLAEALPSAHVALARSAC